MYLDDDQYLCSRLEIKEELCRLNARRSEIKIEIIRKNVVRDGDREHFLLWLAEREAELSQIQAQTSALEAELTSMKNRVAAREVKPSKMDRFFAIFRAEVAAEVGEDKLMEMEEAAFRRMAGSVGAGIDRPDHAV